jgi:hypothetical protein
MNTLVNLSGYFNIASALMMLAYWYLYAVLLPYKELSTTLAILVTHRNWVMVNLLGSTGALLGIVGLVGLYLSVGNQDGRILVIGFIIALLGAVLMFATLLRDTLLWPILVAHDPELLSFSGPIYTSKSFLPFFIFSAAVYSVGYLMFGLAISASSVYPAWTGHFLAWGALLFGLGPLFGDRQVVVRTVGITLFCVGLLYMGIEMRKL